MKATKFVNKIEVENEKQFSAITIIMPDNTLYVSFRGTDNTIVGWKEDFNMSFKSHIASQISAKEYLNMIAELYPNKKIRVGGHSKGGNIAVYSAIFATPQIRDRIINVYNNDGPGFCEDILETQEYQEMINKVHTYIPQSSIIGRLMNHKEKYTIIESTQKGIMQHDLYSWQILGKEFIIGGTANTFDDVKMHYKAGADYIGCGPFRFTTTKKDLSPVLGLEGYRSIILQMKEANIHLPIVAIGGITLEDIPSIMETGITGIALSGTILRAKDPVAETKRIMNL